MVSCRVRNLRALIIIVCGLLFMIITGLVIWRAVIRIQRGTFTPPSTIPIEFCRHGGTWDNGRCICTEEWKGLRCTIVNFCEESNYDNLTFRKIPAGKYGPSTQTCEVGTPNAGSPKATRLCNLTKDGEIKLENATIGNCNENLETLENQICNTSQQAQKISAEAQILTFNASKLTADNITSAANVVGNIFNSPANETEAKRIAVTTVSQLLDASEDDFQRAADSDKNNTFKTLIEQMEIYSLSLNNTSVVEPNIAIQSVNLSSEDTGGSADVRFTVLRGSSNSLTYSSIQVDKQVSNLQPDAQTELQILLKTKQENVKTCGFVVYQNSKFFQSKTFTAKSNFSQKIISSKINGTEKDQSISVEMVFNPQFNQTEFKLNSYACVFWNLSRNDWDTRGCLKNQSLDGFLYCRCNHTTNFAVLMSFIKNYNYPKSLDIISNVGCALSIIGLALTIIFQVATRKVRKTSVTWVLVSLCTSMLIFNLLFLFGIENSNKNLNTNDEGSENNDNVTNNVPATDTIHIPNPTCTAIAALLHYFLLATFTWNVLSAAQLYFLLIWTMKPLPRHFIVFISLIGWGFPAIVVGMTVGIIYSVNGDDSQWELIYRQEEICWLAFQKDNNYIQSPLLWSFFLLVTLILISNVVIFIVITVKVLWKNNQNLTSTKKVSCIKKILSTLSIAVVFGITWVLAYFMLIDNENVSIIFSYIFCLFNATQGFQIFVFYTVRTKIFLSKASTVWKSLSSSAGRVKSVPSASRLKLRLRMYTLVKSFPTLKERFRLLDPSEFTEEMSVSESGEANSSI
ncbi:adhesion G-protein coupled receptor G7 [Trichechus manatus latirostris]|uniref:Adhesion G-protein coupled receptor G7 n=1 Tax=Trichechus manatus latirostris TaxID=127582 RepID=A0A2Y9DQ95_TRIMA|nr:adhesion G-protein coupled receptor G7 [Trichechus manatus latirostris]